MPIAPTWAFLALLTCWIAMPCSAQQVFINEIHYDNSGSDSGEFVEIAGPAGTNLGGYELVFYNGANGSEYDTEALSGALPNEGGSGFGALAFPVSGIQNGAPDGIALVSGATVIQFLSYEGSFIAVDGPASGVLSVDIGVSESGATLAGDSLQLTGSGALYTDFSWSTPTAESPGAINTGQSFSGGVPSILLSVSPAQFTEDAGANAASATLTLTPAPAAPVLVSLAVDIGGQISLPASATVGAGGSATFSIGAVADGVSDGDAVVEITASAPGGAYAPATAAVTVFDIDPPIGRGAAVRLATYNVRNGVGVVGSPEYDQVLAVLRRIGPDVICFTEASPTGDFANLKNLLADLGMETSDAHFATAGDAFSANAYVSGDFGSGQAVAIASRWPITSALQIGRGELGRTEMTRYPLMVTVNVPGITAEVLLVGTHLKAGGTDADNFRRAVEAYRIRQAIETAGYSGASDNVFVMGDINEDFEDFLPNSYSTSLNPPTHVFGDGSTFPASYLLGADIAPPNGITLGYNGFPAPAFAPVDIGIIDSRQQDGARRTFNPIGDARLDYILPSDFIVANSPPQTEVYNSLLEFGFEGLPKPGPVPAGAASFIATDHHAVFGDFFLQSTPRILVNVSPGAIDERAPVPLSASVEIIPPPSVDTVVNLYSEFGRFAMPAAVEMPAGSGTVSFPIALARAGRLGANGELRLTGYANGHASGHDFIDVISQQASGVLLFSQYIEPPSGGSPKAVEIVNASGVDIDFTETPMRLLLAFNGGALNEQLLLADGLLPAGEVIVVGGATAGDYLVAQGLLPNPGAAFSTFDDGTLFNGSSGNAVYVKRTMVFNGDDALQVELSYTLADTFGTVGVDPGAQWAGGGVSSANQNIELRADVGTGSPGWMDPSSRFELMAAGSNLAGFGTPPLLNDPYRAWASSFGLLGTEASPSEDLDCDGLSNLMEYALGGNPWAVSGMRPQAVIVTSGGVQYLGMITRRRVTPGRLQYTLELSADLNSWVPSPAIEDGVTVDNGDGTETVTLRSAQPASAADGFVRLRAELP